jgi:hypothetical protein
MAAGALRAPDSSRSAEHPLLQATSRQRRTDTPRKCAHADHVNSPSPGRQALSYINSSGRAGGYHAHASRGRASPL